MASKVLKLTVGLDVYSEMTAPAGCRGRKSKEIRPDGDWIRARLDGREYEYVKLYAGLPYLDESKTWTMFECLGYECVGSEGVEYEVENYGDGFVLVVEGLVWEIHLGVVVDRHFPDKSHGQVLKVEDEDSDTNALGTNAVDERARRSGADLPPLLPPPPPPPMPTGGSIKISDLSQIGKVFNDVRKEDLAILKETLAVCKALATPAPAHIPTLASAPPANTVVLTMEQLMALIAKRS